MNSLSVKAVTNRHGHVVTLEETGKGHIKVWGNGVTLSQDEALQLRDWLNDKYPAPPAAAHGDEAVPDLVPGLQWAIDYCNAMLCQGNDRMLAEVIRTRLENVLSNQPAAMRAQGDGGEA